MLYRVIDLAYSPALGRIDDEPLQRLLHGHVVAASTERFYVHDSVPHLLVSLRFQHAAAMRSTIAPTPPPPKPDQRQDLRALVDQASWPLLDSLRSWRSAKAREEGFPAYVILTNDQLVEVVRLKPRTLADLGKINGLGDGRLARYGREVLGVVENGVVQTEAAQ